MNKLLPVIFCVFFLYSTSAQLPTPVSGSARVKAAASGQYTNPTFFQRLILGSNYRKEWSTPVEVPVFRIKEMGFTILQLGGGKQTKSLRLKDKKGQEWVLRTVEKNVEPNLPPLLKNTIAERVVQDMVSAAHPYAPLTIPTLANAIGIVVPVPTLYYIPSDENLQPYKSIFEHSLCYLEEREPTPDNTDTKGTEKMLEDLVEKNDHQVIQTEVLKARLLDMLVADWDRHADQWRWGDKDSAGAKYYYAIPRDRDQAFFNSNGILIRIARYVAARHFVGFRSNLKKLTDLNFKAWNFDETFLNELDRDQWNGIINDAQKALTDSVIEEAVRKMPSNIYAISGKEIEGKLKKRRNDLSTAGMEYYSFLANTVAVHGTDKAEIFKFKASGAGLHLVVYDKEDGKEGRKLYERTFIHKETVEITLAALGGNDAFIIDENLNSKIKIIILGGKGKDLYRFNGSVHTTVYEYLEEENIFEGKKPAVVKSI